MNRRGIFTSMAVAVGVCVVPTIGAPTPVSAAATTTVALYEMNEPVGSTTLVDSSGNGLNGSIGSEVHPGVVFSGSTVHRYDFLTPNTPPAHPGHLDTVPDSSILDAGTQDYAVTVRYRTTRSFGNLIQKGQNKSTGGYFKIELPNGFVTCLFKGSRGEQRAVKSPTAINDGTYHTIRCERLSTAVSLYIDGVRVARLAGSTGSISNIKNLSIAGKSECDQIEVTCDYFVGDIDYVRIEKGSAVANTPPTAAFSSNCNGLSCGFNGTASSDPGGNVVSYAWNFGDNTTGTGPTPTHVYAQGGTYTARLTVTDNLGANSAPVTHDVTVTAPNAPPTAAFASECADYTCTFDSSGSSDANGPITAWAWDFGDGGTSDLPNPSHLFAGPGLYTVGLTVTDGQTTTGQVSHQVEVLANVAPVAAFTQTCSGLSCTFDASTSTDANGPITSYEWDFGDGSTGTGVQASRIYGAAADYLVTLTATDSFGQAGTASHTVSPVQAVSNITFVGQASTSANAASHAANVPVNVQPGDALLLFFSTGTNPAIAQPTGVTGWTAVDTLTNTNGTTRVWKKVAVAGDAGAQVRISTSPTTLVKGNLMIVAYRGTSADDPVAGFARLLQTTSTASRATPVVNVAGSGSWVISYWMHRDSSSTSLSVPAGVTSRSTGTQTGGGRVTTLLADSAAAVPAGSYGGLTATAQTASSVGTTWTIVLAPA